jgi:hypothetical protein
VLFTLSIGFEAVFVTVNFTAIFAPVTSVKPLQDTVFVGVPATVEHSP